MPEAQVPGPEASSLTAVLCSNESAFSFFAAPYLPIFHPFRHQRRGHFPAFLLLRQMTAAPPNTAAPANASRPAIRLFMILPTLLSAMISRRGQAPSLLTDPIYFFLILSGHQRRLLRSPAFQLSLQKVSHDPSHKTGNRQRDYQRQKTSQIGKCGFPSFCSLLSHPAGMSAFQLVPFSCPILKEKY